MSDKPTQQAEPTDAEMELIRDVDLISTDAFVAKLRAHVATATAELRAEIGAWHNLFGTTQLSHAIEARDRAVLDLATEQRQLAEAQAECDRLKRCGLVMEDCADAWKQKNVALTAQLAASQAARRDEESWWKEKHDYKARAEKAEAAEKRLRDLLGFAASCIKSGEAWSPTCESMFASALAPSAGPPTRSGNAAPGFIKDAMHPDGTIHGAPGAGATFVGPGAGKCEPHPERDRHYELLKRVFIYLGTQIKWMSLSESAENGTQALSKEIAQLLDAARKTQEAKP